MSPGFTPRPSLSEDGWAQAAWTLHVSPGFTPRPSLSGERVCGNPNCCIGVAGVHTSAFVERTTRPTGGFGFTPRPSLSVLQSSI